MYDVLTSRNLIGHVFPLRILKGHASSRAVFLFTYSPNIALQNVFALNAYMVIVVGVNRRKLIKKYGSFSIIVCNRENNQTYYPAFREDTYWLHILEKYRNHRLNSFGDIGENIRTMSV